MMLVIKSTDLRWESWLNCFTVDASDLEALYPIQRLDYEDGKWFLTVQSARTGNLARFYRQKELKTPDGELASVMFYNPDHNLALYINND